MCSEAYEDVCVCVCVCIRGREGDCAGVFTPCDVIMEGEQEAACKVEVWSGVCGRGGAADTLHPPASKRCDHGHVPITFEEN